MTPTEIRAGLRSRILTPDEALQLTDAELSVSESAALWVLRGDLIQLSDWGEYTLAHARASYERAVELAPASPEAYEELGHFFDSIEPDEDRAIDYYREALARGAGESCRIALEAAMCERTGSEASGRRTRR